MSFTLRKCSFDSFVLFFLSVSSNFAVPVPLPRSLSNRFFDSHSNLVFVKLLVFGTFNFFLALDTLHGIFAEHWTHFRQTRENHKSWNDWAWCIGNRLTAKPHYPIRTFIPDTHRPRKRREEEWNRVQSFAFMWHIYWNINPKRCHKHSCTIVNVCCVFWFGTCLMYMYVFVYVVYPLYIVYWCCDMHQRVVFMSCSRISYPQLLFNLQMGIRLSITSEWVSTHPVRLSLQIYLLAIGFSTRLAVF